MTPYADFLYFGLLLYPVIPTILLGLLGRINWRWIAFVTLLALVVQFGESLRSLPRTAVPEIYLVIAFGLWQWIAAEGFLFTHKRSKNRWPYYVALLFSFLPLAIAKFTPLIIPGSLLGFLGISYVTFRSLDVIFGIQDGLITTLPSLQYLASVFSSKPFHQGRLIVIAALRKIGTADGAATNFCKTSTVRYIASLRDSSTSSSWQH